MFCSKCGADLKYEAKFCPKCGAAVAYDSDEGYGNMRGDYNQPNYYSQPSPVQNEPRAYAPPAYMTQPPKKGGTSAAKIVFSCILALLFLFNLHVTFGVAAVKSLANSETVKTALMKADIPDIEVEENGEKKTVGDLIYDRLPEGMRSETGMSRDSFKQLLNDVNFKNDFSDLIARYISHFMGDKSQTVTKQDIIDAIKSDEDLIYRVTNYRISAVDMAEIEKYLNSEDFKMITTDGLDKELSGINLGTIFTVIIGMFAFLAIVCAGIILLINKRHISHSLLYIGIPLLITGFMFMSAALSASAASVTTFLQPVLWMFTLIGIICLVLGAAMVVAFILVTLFRNKRELIKA